MNMHSSDLAAIAGALSGPFGTFGADNLISYGFTAVVVPGAATNEGVALTGAEVQDLLGDDYQVFPMALEYGADPFDDELAALDEELEALGHALGNAEGYGGVKGLRRRYLRVVARYRKCMTKQQIKEKRGRSRRCARRFRKMEKRWAKMERKGGSTEGLPSPEQVEAEFEEAAPAPAPMPVAPRVVIRRPPRMIVRRPAPRVIMRRPPMRRPSRGTWVPGHWQGPPRRAAPAPRPRGYVPTSQAVSPWYHADQAALEREAASFSPRYGADQAELAADLRAEAPTFLFGEIEHDYFGIDSEDLQVVFSDEDDELGAGASPVGELDAQIKAAILGSGASKWTLVRQSGALTALRDERDVLVRNGSNTEGVDDEMREILVAAGANPAAERAIKALVAERDALIVGGYSGDYGDDGDVSDEDIVFGDDEDLFFGEDGDDDDDDLGAFWHSKKRRASNKKKRRLKRGFRRKHGYKFPASKLFRPKEYAKRKGQFKQWVQAHGGPPGAEGASWDLRGGRNFGELDDPDALLGDEDLIYGDDDDLLGDGGDDWLGDDDDDLLYGDDDDDYGDDDDDDDAYYEGDDDEFGGPIRRAERQMQRDGQLKERLATRLSRMKARIERRLQEGQARNPERAQRRLERIDAILSQGSQNNGVDYGRLQPKTPGTPGKPCVVIAIRKRAGAGGQVGATRNHAVAEYGAVGAGYVPADPGLLDVFAADLHRVDQGLPGLAAMAQIQQHVDPGSYIMGDDEEVYEDEFGIYVDQFGNEVEEVEDEYGRRGFRRRQRPGRSATDVQRTRKPGGGRTVSWTGKKGVEHSVERGRRGRVQSHSRTQPSTTQSLSVLPGLPPVTVTTPGATTTRRPPLRRPPVRRVVRKVVKHIYRPAAPASASPVAAAVVPSAAPIMVAAPVRTLNPVAAAGPTAPVPSWARRFGDDPELDEAWAESALLQREASPFGYDEYDDYGDDDDYDDDDDFGDDFGDDDLDAELAAYGIDASTANPFPIGAEAPFPAPRRTGREVY